MAKNTPAALSEDEFAELDELLAEIGEEHRAMAADEADGFLTGLLLNPQEASPDEWIGYVLDENGRTPEELDEDTLYRLEDLLYRRYLEIDRQLAARNPLDPVILEDEEDEASDELTPFAIGFLTSMKTFPGLLEVDAPEVRGALVGILRHLPEELQGDLEETIRKVNEESPLDGSAEALDDLVACVAEIAEVTRGFVIKD